MIVEKIQLDIEAVLSRYRIERLEQFYHVLRNENEKLNLVSRETIETGLPQLVAESLLPLHHLPKERFTNYLDIGSGGGIPSIPIILTKKIFIPTLVERIGKKAKSLERMSTALSLENVEIRNLTLEDIKFKKKFDLISMRLVKLTDKLLKIIIQNLADDGIFLYYFKPEFEMEKFSCSTVTYSYSTGLKTPDKYFSVITKNI